EKCLIGQEAKSEADRRAGDVAGERPSPNSMSESWRTFLENFDRGASLTTGRPWLIEATTGAYSLGVFQYTGRPNVSRACFTVTSSPVPSRMTTTLTFLRSRPRWRKAASAAA